MRFNLQSPVLRTLPSPVRKSRARRVQNGNPPTQWHPIQAIQRDAQDNGSYAANIASRSIGVGIAAFLLAASPATAELQTIPAEQVTTVAKPLKVQQVNKGRVWLLFILGASSLFGATVLLESNEAWFPAIARANRALTASRNASQAREAREQEEQHQFEERLEDVREERSEDLRLESAVLAGLAEARRDVAAVATPKEQSDFDGNAGVVAEAQSGDDTAESLHEESNGTFPAELSSGQGKPTPENQGDGGGEVAQIAEPEERKPLFEIGSDQIKRSTRNIQRQMPEGVSLDDLQRELEGRKAAQRGDE